MIMYDTFNWLNTHSQSAPMWFTLLACYVVATQLVNFIPAPLTSACVPQCSRSAQEVCPTNKFSFPQP